VCFCRSGGLVPVSFPLLQGRCSGAGSSELALFCVVALLGWSGGRACAGCRMADILSVIGVTADKTRFWPAIVCPLLDQSGHCSPATAQSCGRAARRMTAAAPQASADLWACSLATDFVLRRRVSVFTASFAISSIKIRFSIALRSITPPQSGVLQEMLRLF
jgi:hypothetical protein